MIKKFTNKLQFFKSSLSNLFIRNIRNFYVSEIEDWVIKDIGNSILKHSKKKIKITYSSIFIKNSTIHFGSLNTYLIQPFDPHISNKIIVTWYHIPNNFKLNNLIIDKLKKVDIWITSNSISMSKLIELGIPKNKINIIPIAVDDIFLKSNNKQNQIDNDYFVIGSFLKDGAGWKNGEIPKYIKGPDILIETLINLNKKHNIKVNLSGPSRGYVINSLKKHNIPFEYKYFETKSELVEFYKSCNICLITSREEGGPLSLLESISLNVPVVSTKVGMAVDIINNGINGYLSEIDDVNDLVSKISVLINDKSTLNSFREKTNDIKIYGFKDVINSFDKLYEVQ